MSTEEAPVEKPEQPDLFGAHADKIVAKLDELQRSFVPAKKTEPEQKKPRATLAQLKAAVEAGTISDVQMAEEIRRQDREDIQADLEQKMAARLETSSVESRREAQAQKLVAEYPDFNDRSSDLFKAAAAAWQELINDGAADDSLTRLTAMKMAAKAQPKVELRETTAQRQRSVEAAGSSSGRTSTKKTESSAGGWPSWLEPHRREYYEEAISKGRYTGRKDPMLEKELAILEKRRSA